MVREADYIYGVVPARGEYGFERKPAKDDPAVRSRVQSITSSFQWSAAASNDAEAIAVDRTDPPLVVRIITDPRDPAGRRSVCMHIWVASESESIATMIAELWPRNVALPISQDEFLLWTERETSGRVVVGPGNSFTAVGFDQSWGIHTTTHNQASRSSSGLTVRESTTISSRNLHNSKGWFKRSIKGAILAPLLLVPTAIAVMQYWEVERLEEDKKKLAEVKTEAAEANALLTRQLEKVDKENQQYKDEVNRQARELVKLQSERERLKSRIAELDSVVGANSAKVDQAELLALRSFKAAVEEYIQDQKTSFQKLEDAVPDTPSKIGKISEKFSEIIHGKNNNE